MTEKISSEQITLLREMMCTLACYPNRHSPADLAQALRQLVEGLNLDAAGVYWQTDGHLQSLAHWPPPFTPPPTDTPDHTTTIPMRCDGATLGQLWLVASRSLTPAEHDFITLAANQLAIIWQNSRLYRQLAALAERRGELLHRLIQADEQCSRRVSRELHDEISQSLTALLFEVDTILTTHLFNRVEIVEHHLNHLRGELIRVTDEVNRIVLDLRPTLLENNGLIAALGWYGTERLRPAGVKLHLSSGQCIPHLSDCATTMLYRIAQEALTNVVRHAQAANVWLNLTCLDGYLFMTIQDDGRGFDAGQGIDYANSIQGIGLLGMQERAMLLNGNFSINTQPGCGVEIQIKIPMEEATGDAHQSVAGRRPCGAAR